MKDIKTLIELARFYKETIADLQENLNKLLHGKLDKFLTDDEQKSQLQEFFEQLRIQTKCYLTVKPEIDLVVNRHYVTIDNDRKALIKDVLKDMVVEDNE